MGVEDFLLGRNFQRTYQVLVDLTSMKIVVRAPVPPVWHHAHTQVGDATSAVPFARDGDLVLQLFERTVVNPLTTTSLVIDLTDTKATTGSQTISVEDDTYATVKVKTAGTG